MAETKETPKSVKRLPGVSEVIRTLNTATHPMKEFTIVKGGKDGLEAEVVKETDKVTVQIPSIGMYEKGSSRIWDTGYPYWLGNWATGSTSNNRKGHLGYTAVYGFVTTGFAYPSGRQYLGRTGEVQKEDDWEEVNDQATIDIHRTYNDYSKFDTYDDKEDATYINALKDAEIRRRQGSIDLARSVNVNNADVLENLYTILNGVKNSARNHDQSIMDRSLLKYLNQCKELKNFIVDKSGAQRVENCTFWNAGFTWDKSSYSVVDSGDLNSVRKDYCYIGAYGLNIFARRMGILTSAWKNYTTYNGVDAKSSPSDYITYLKAYVNKYAEKNGEDPNSVYARLLVQFATNTQTQITAKTQQLTTGNPDVRDQNRVSTIQSDINDRDKEIPKEIQSQVKQFVPVEAVSGSIGHALRLLMEIDKDYLEAQLGFGKVSIYDVLGVYTSNGYVDFIVTRVDDGKIMALSDGPIPGGKEITSGGPHLTNLYGAVTQFAKTMTTDASKDYTASVSLDSDDDDDGDFGDVWDEDSEEGENNEGEQVEEGLENFRIFQDRKTSNFMIADSSDKLVRGDSGKPYEFPTEEEAHEFALDESIKTLEIDDASKRLFDFFL